MGLMHDNPTGSSVAPIAFNSGVWQAVLPVNSSYHIKFAAAMMWFVIVTAYNPLH